MKQILTKKLPPLFKSFTLVFFLLSLAGGASADSAFPNPRGYVNDFAKVISSDMTVKIENLCKSLEEKTGAQIAVATFPDIGDGDIDDFTVKLFEQWQIGQKGKDNGILIVQAIAERKVKIEVGYGLEPIITDAITGRIRRDDMTPLLKAGKYGEAHLLAVSQLAAIILKGGEDNKEQLRKNKPFRMNFFFLIFLFIIFISIFRKRRFGGGNRWGGSGGPWIGGLGGGGFGGGGGGGGGFGGFGGGGSGGGGSSGGY